MFNESYKIIVSLIIIQCDKIVSEYIEDVIVADVFAD